ncbi:hypothetical protein MMC26_007720 [Xylographa opegraphella]|nr:hypothetical protein [Xylographa opegraphella]
MAAGSDKAIQAAKFLLEEMSGTCRLAIVPGGIGAGSDMKMAHQVLAAIHILAANEAMGLASRLAEQVYLSGLSRGMGPEDDAGLIRLYLQEPGLQQVSSPKAAKRNSASDMKLVISLLRGIHLCAAAESIAFADHLGLNLSQFFDVVNSAAGGSWIFRDRAPTMIANHGKHQKTEWIMHDRLSNIKTSVDSMSAVVQAARDVNCPLYLGNAALNILLTMKHRGWDECTDESVVKFWGNQT